MKENKVILGFFWKFMERICAQFVSFFITILLARILMPEDYGIISMILVFITIADVFVTSGFSSSLIQNKEADEKDFSTMFYLSLISAILIYIILYLLAPYIAKFYGMPQLSLILRVLALKLPIASINSIQHAYVSKKLIFKKFFFATLIGTIISGVVGVIMAYKGFGVWALVAQYLTNSFIDTAVLFITVPWRPKLLFSVKNASKMIKYGSKVTAAELISNIYTELRSLVIGKLYTSKDLAYYKRGNQFPELIINNIDSSMGSVLFPAISNNNTSKENVKNITRKAIKLSTYLIFPMMTGMFAVARPLINVLLTEKWAMAIGFMQIQCIIQMTKPISTANNQAIKALGRSDIFLKMEIFKKSIGLCLLFATMKISVKAIAYSMIVYSFIATIVNIYPNKKLMNYSIKEQVKDFLPSLFISTIMGVICYLFNYLYVPNSIILLLQIIVGIIIYITLSYVFQLEAYKTLVNYMREIELFTKIYNKLYNLMFKILGKVFSLNIFKINNKKIVFSNFLGKGYGCNPKYIAEEIIRQQLDYDLVWIVNDINEDMPSQIRKVKFGSLQSLYELSTAKIWIDNVRNYKGVHKKRKQFYIQTWHGGISLKRIEKDVEDTLTKKYIKEAQYDGTIIDLLITNNKDQEKYFKEIFWYDGGILCCGTPRNDIIYKNEDKTKEKVYSYFGIDKNKKIVMYAPTFRKDENIDAYIFDYEKCCRILSKKFGDEFVMLIRLHPNVSEKSGQIEYSDNVKNASKYPDIQEMIAATEVIITDFSSLSLDAGLVNKPVFTIAKDFDNYIKNDRKMLYNIDELPFTMNKTEEELYNSIERFEMESYKKRLEQFYEKIGVVHNSDSAKDIVNIINDKCKIKECKNENTRKDFIKNKKDSKKQEKILYKK